MPFTDLPLDRLRQHTTADAEPADLDARWDATLAEARSHDLDLRRERVDARLPLVDVEDITYAGFGGDPIRAWYLRPAGAKGDLPIVVEYNGYGGGRGLPLERLLWPSAGYATLFMDTRGQGSGWGSGGHTPDRSGGADAAGPAHPGFMTRGILDFDTYYYRRLYTDAVRLLDVVPHLEGVDASKVVVAGGSQGGGLAIAAASLGGGVAAAIPEVPFLSDIRRGVDVADKDPYQEIARYLAVHHDHVEAAFRTLSYIDGAHLAKRATAPALFSAGLRDAVVPPSTVFAAANAWGGDASVEVYPYNGHEGGAAHHKSKQVAFLRDVLG
ncbi:acetylxylan esterase [Microbacterium indicum]|uniref:acetylxylan esterase n=1 Tax=Microbacterium indicum TaxID=358100 RepID=UPI00042A8F85|nr:acetylxylan esterase [Microbacterium indicum]